MTIRIHKPFLTAFFLGLGVVAAALCGQAYQSALKEAEPEDPPYRIEYAPVFVDPHYAPSTEART